MLVHSVHPGNGKATTSSRTGTAVVAGDSPAVFDSDLRLARAGRPRPHKI